MQYELDIPQQSAKKSPFSLREKAEALAAVKLRGEDPGEVLAPLYEKHGRTLPRYPAQAMSAWGTQLKSLVARGDQVAIDLARELGFTLHKVGDRK